MGSNPPPTIHDIQTKDIIKHYNEHYKELRQSQILFIPTEPGQPWVVKDVLDGKKFRLWTSGIITKTMVRR